MPDRNLPEIEARLLHLIATGDRRAFEGLYDRLLPRVLGLATRILKDHSQSEEVAQEVFLELWEQASRFDPNRGSAVAWVLRKTHGRAVDRVRASQSGTRRDVKIGIRDLAPLDADVLDTVALRIESERIGHALDRLPPAQRDAVRLAHLGGYSHSEVSIILHVPVGTVKTRIRSGLIRLREELAVA